MLIRPRRLHPGDVITLVTPASAPPDPKAIDRGIAAVEAMGFKVQLGRHSRKRMGFLAGNDRERAADIMHAFIDRKVQGVLCVRGGYGSGRLLKLLDFQTIRNNPKIFAGYSDITSLHCALLTQCGLISFHSPMAVSDFAEKDYPAFSQDSFRKLLTEPAAYGSIRQGYQNKTVKILRHGKVSGELIGGNLTLLAATIGTPYQPSFQKKILFFEDLGEKPYQIDRMLTHFLNAGLLEQVAGIAVGICADCIDPKAKTATEYRQTLDDVLRDRLLPLRVPVVTGLPFGHLPFNATLPIGGRAILDGQKGDLVLTSAAVS